jgi:hypothetical protein
MNDTNRNTTRLALFCALALVTAPALAEWEKVLETDAAAYFMDSATLQKNGSLRRVWQVQNLKQRDKDGELSRRALVEYECREGINRTLSIAMHADAMGEGKKLDAYSDPSSPRKVVPGSSGEVILKLVCAR